MGLVSAGRDAVRGTFADQWLDFFTAPTFDEHTLVAPGVRRRPASGRPSFRATGNIITEGTKVVVPESTAVIVTDGGRVVSVSTEPGYFIFRDDGQSSILAGAGPYRSLIAESWERFKFGGEPSRQQEIYFVNLREIRNIPFGTPGPLPYRDLSLAPDGSSRAPVLRIRARGWYSIQIVDPIRFFQNFLPANVRSCSLSDHATRSQLSHEFITCFQATLQSLSRKIDIGSLASHGRQLAEALSTQEGPGGSWQQRFGLTVVSTAISSIEYDQESRELMDKYNKGTLLAGATGNAYAQSTVADAALAMGQSGAGGEGLIGLAMGLGSMSGTLSGMSQPVPDPVAPQQNDPVAVLGQLKAMLDQGLITPEQYAAKQAEVLKRM